MSMKHHRKANFGLNPPPTQFFSRGFEFYEMTYRASIHQRGHQNKNVGHHLPEGKQTGPRHIPPRAASALRLPGKGATRVPIIARAAAPFQVPSRTWRRCPCLGDRRPAGAREVRALARGSGPPGGCAPSAAPRAPIAALPPRVGPRAVAAPGSRPLPGSQRVRFSFTTKSLRHSNPTGGQSGRAPGQGPERRRRGRRRMKIQPTSLDRDLLQSISGRRPDHMGTAKSQANSSEGQMLQPCKLQEGSQEGRLFGDKTTSRGHNISLVDNKDLEGRNSGQSTGPGTSWDC
ncbi:uncharacterized protein LOC118356893 [Zalophus californianus]|uniref:Uncharacterized protein LOC118356893 n=1 Tax=Zalophus californianus TaxID=9704 RepID=A0A6P9FKT4_ZALCA|nr:uncharacterized protein LOC118356893 [Zalophus californianus]